MELSTDRLNSYISIEVIETLSPDPPYKGVSAIIFQLYPSGLLLSSIFDKNPVIFVENRWLYNLNEKVPTDDFRVPIGKASFEEDALFENFATVIEELQRVKPSGSKGKYLKKVVISSTMGPGVKVDENSM